VAHAHKIREHEGVSRVGHRLSVTLRREALWADGGVHLYLSTKRNDHDQPCCHGRTSTLLVVYCSTHKTTGLLAARWTC